MDNGNAPRQCLQTRLSVNYFRSWCDIRVCCTLIFWWCSLSKRKTAENQRLSMLSVCTFWHRKSPKSRNLIWFAIKAVTVVAAVVKKQKQTKKTKTKTKTKTKNKTKTKKQKQKQKTKQNKTKQQQQQQILLITSLMRPSSVGKRVVFY